MQNITKNQISYICRDMLGLNEWNPDIRDTDKVLQVLNLCQSQLEIMYLLGAYHYIEQNGKESGHSVGYITDAEIIYEGKKYPAIWFFEPWGGWYTNFAPIWSGPSAMAFAPQIEIANLHYDFGIFYGDDNGSPKWHLDSIIEIDGYGVHKDRRNLDKLRDEILKQKNISYYRFQEEIDSPLLWFDKLVRADYNVLEKQFREE
jgi:hypothetical protein